MSTQPFPLSQILNVTVVVTPSAAGPAFNQALIVGSSNSIPSVGANSRMRLYESLADVAVDFAASTSEYKAAALYFGPYPAPTYLWIGRQDLTAIVTAVIATPGTGYALGDLVTVVQAGGSLGVLRVTEVSGTVPVSVEVVSGGTGYTAASALPVDLAGGLTVDITVGETPAEAIAICRRTTGSWYACMYVGTATDPDHIAIADYVETAQPASMYFLTSGSADILTEGSSPASNLFALLQLAGYTRTFSVYSTTVEGAYPSNEFASAAVLGAAMARVTGLANSYFDIMFKAIVGVNPEALTIAQAQHIAGSVDRSVTGLNGNVIVLYQNGAIWCQSGVMASGDWFDQVLFLDMLVNDMQTSGVALLIDSPSVPITEVGVLQMKNAIGGACERSQAMGFIGPSGVWEGPTIGSGAGALTKGSSLPKGYFLYAQPVSTWTRRAERVMPPITVALVMAQSGHSLSVTVLVQP